MTAWNKGTEKFYKQAKSILSNNNSNFEGSVISGLSRSRSGSKDVMLNRQITTSFLGANNFKAGAYAKNAT